MPQQKKTVVSCPQCGKSVVWDRTNPYRPFCSERCKLIDLGKWAAEEYKIKDEGGRMKDEEKPA